MSLKQVKYEFNAFWKNKTKKQNKKTVGLIHATLFNASKTNEFLKPIRCIVYNACTLQVSNFYSQLASFQFAIKVGEWRASCYIWYALSTQMRKKEERVAQNPDCHLMNFLCNCPTHKSTAFSLSRLGLAQRVKGVSN